jgi:hypothetical protein
MTRSGKDVSLRVDIETDSNRGYGGGSTTCGLPAGGMVFAIAGFVVIRNPDASNINRSRQIPTRTTQAYHLIVLDIKESS